MISPYTACTVSRYTPEAVQLMASNNCAQNPSVWVKNIRWEDIANLEYEDNEIMMTVMQEYQKHEFVVRKTPLAEQAFEPYIIFDEE